MRKFTFLSFAFLVFVAAAWLFVGAGHAQSTGAPAISITTPSDDDEESADEEEEKGGKEDKDEEEKDEEEKAKTKSQKKKARRKRKAAARKKTTKKDSASKKSATSKKKAAAGKADTAADDDDAKDEDEDEDEKDAAVEDDGKSKSKSADKDAEKDGDDDDEAEDKPEEELTPEQLAEKQAKEAKEQEEKQQKEQISQQRLQKIQKLTFDRRPSAMLNAWSTPEEEENAEDKKNKEGDDTDDEGEDGKDSKKDDDKAEETPPDPVATAVAEFEKELKAFQGHVTIGDWGSVAKFLKDLEEEKESEALYKQLLTALARPPAKKPQQAQLPDGTVVEINPFLQQLQAGQAVGNAGKRYVEKQAISVQDIIGLIESAPKKLKKSQIYLVASLLKNALSTGDVLEEFLIPVREKGDRLLTKRQTALLLANCGRLIELGEFIPGLDECVSQDDREGLNLLTMHFLALYERDEKLTQLTDAWNVTQAALADGEIDKDEKMLALHRAVEMAPKVDKELGELWLNESFTKRPERGKEILSTIGTATAKSLSTKTQLAPERLRGLELQRTAVDALINNAPEQAKEWRETLNLLAFNWLQEAQVTLQYGQSTSRGASIRRDSYGNIYYMGDSDYYRGYSRSSNRPQAIEVAGILKTRPDGKWLELVNDSIKSKYDMVFSELHLKVNEDKEAFPYIEKLAESYPEKAKELANTFLDVWTSNHNPNEAKDRTNYYMYMYGYERKADRIPLTRSKQERNLEELSAWIERLRKLPISEELDEKRLVRAFTTSHSSAEVYRLESIERVFGSIDQLKPETLAEMIQQMRVNLIGVWRIPAEQKKQGTKRKKRDIQMEVQRGYEVANAVLEGGLAKYPDTWQLTVAKAAIKHDQNDFQQEVAKSTEFSARRKAAFALYALAAEQYASTVEDLPENEQTTTVYDQWFYSALGATDLGRVTQETVSDLNQINKIKSAMDQLPGLTAKKHIDRFANQLFNRMSAVNPACKFRYLRNGFKIVGDHPQAHEARQVFDYYHDLVKEIELDVAIDGNDVVGHEEPFGLYINVRHTKEIERESGGFAKYLQNQNNSYYSYNYGRPTANYRDKFEEAVRKSLDEQFEVLTVTFNHSDTKSYAVKPYGWRVTPYAHVMLKARGPEVDTIPSMQLDLDFLDTSGYVVIPITSSSIPVDASKREPRPFNDLKIVQTLDERQSTDGRLVLEIKATAHGLVPKMDEIMKLAPEGFEITENDDLGVTISEFDKESSEVEISSERLWNITMQAKDSNAARPKEFAFAASLDDKATATYQRYVDADLVDVERKISLEQKYGNAKSRFPIYAPLGLLAFGGCIFALRKLNAKEEKASADGPLLPENLTPFTALAVLKDIQANNGIRKTDMERLTGEINRLEQHYFVEPSTDEPNLEAITREWLTKSKPR